MCHMNIIEYNVFMHWYTYKQCICMRMYNIVTYGYTYAYINFTSPYNETPSFHLTNLTGKIGRYLGIILIPQYCYQTIHIV